MIKGAESFYLKPKPETDKKIGVLLFHGWTSSPYELKKLGEFLSSKGYVVFAPLLPGHGTIPDDLNNFEWKDWADFAEESYQKIKSDCQDVFAGGVSMGGNLAIRLAANHPEINGLITMGTPLFLRNFFLRIFLPLLIRIHPITNKSYASYRRLEILKYKRHYWSFPTKSVGDAIDGMKDSSKNAKKVKCPALVMQSTKDQLLTPANARVLFQKLGTPEIKKELVWIKDSDHTFIIDIYAEEIFSRIEEFLLNSQKSIKSIKSKIED